MAEETTGDQQAQEPNGEARQPEPDWKAKYEETLAHSREWEKRAKANKTAADELQQLKESQMSEAQKAEARTARLQKELDQLKAHASEDAIEEVSSCMDHGEEWIGTVIATRYLIDYQVAAP